MGRRKWLGLEERDLEMPVRGGGNAAYMVVDNSRGRVMDATPSEALVR